MKTPSCVIWSLTKKNNAHLVKFNGNQWSSHPRSISGFHNASESASPAGVQVKRVPTKKNFKRVFILNVAHNQHHGLKKASKSCVACTCIPLSKGQNAAAKAVNKQMHLNQVAKNKCLKRLARQHAANRSNVAKAE